MMSCNGQGAEGGGRPADRQTGGPICTHAARDRQAQGGKGGRNKIDGWEKWRLVISGDGETRAVS